MLSKLNSKMNGEDFPNFVWQVTVIAGSVYFISHAVNVFFGNCFGFTYEVELYVCMFLYPIALFFRFTGHFKKVLNV